MLRHLITSDLLANLLCVCYAMRPIRHLIIGLQKVDNTIGEALQMLCEAQKIFISEQQNLSNVNNISRDHRELCALLNIPFKIIGSDPNQTPLETIKNDFYQPILRCFIKKLNQKTSNRPTTLKHLGKIGTEDIFNRKESLLEVAKFYRYCMPRALR